MAHIRSGSIVSDIRGKVGQEIYSRNKGGAYVKAYAAPVQPGSSRQGARQADFAVAVNAWTNLSESDKQMWEDFANGDIVTSHMGDTRTRSGRALYISRFLNSRRADDSTVEYPYPPNEWLAMDISVTSITGTTLNFLVDFEPTNYEWAIILFISDQFPTTIRSFNSVQRQRFRPFYFDSSPSFNYYSSWNNIYGSGPLVAGNRIFFEVERMHIPSGSVQARTRFIQTIT